MVVKIQLIKMGHPADIFLEQPSASCMCAICHDVLREASALTCGHTHTFCNECIDALMSSGGNRACPNCRMPVASASPNYVVRDIINAICASNALSGTLNESGGDDNAHVGCSWTGQIQNLKDHGDKCKLKIINCSAEGCQHTCMRKYMEDHLSSTDGRICT